MFNKNQYLIDSLASSHTVKKIRVIFCWPNFI